MNPQHRIALTAIAGLAAGVLFIGVLWILVSTYSLAESVRATQVDRTQITDATKASADSAAEAAETAARSLARIEDCTTKGGECFEANQRRTGEVVTGINRGTLAVIVAALSCQDDGIVGQRELARCTVERADDTKR